MYTLGEVITFRYIISYTTEILLKVNGSSIHEDFWCVFQEFVINQNINRLFLVAQVGWLTRKQKFPWIKHSFKSNTLFSLNFYQIKDFGPYMGLGTVCLRPVVVRPCSPLASQHLPRASGLQPHPHPAARAASTGVLLTPECSWLQTHSSNSSALGKGDVWKLLATTLRE